MAARVVIRIVLTLALVVTGLVFCALAVNAQTGTSDISVAKTGPVQARPGDLVTYTIAVTNNGPDVATNVFMDDSLPAGESFITLIPNGGCTTPPSGGGGVVECLMPSLASGLTSSFALTVQVAASVPDGTLIRNTAVVQADQTDPVPSNNSGTSTLTVLVPRADIAITKSGPATARPTDNVVYTVTVTNNGPDTATNVTWSDTLPAGETLDSVSFPGGSGCSFPATSTVSCSTSSLANGASASFSLTATVGAAMPDGTVLNNTATAASDQLDPNPANNSSTSSLTVTAFKADVAVTKVGPPEAVAGDPANLVYTIVVTNNGPDDAQAVVLADSLPAGETFVAQGETSGPTFTLANTSNSITDTIATLPAQTSASFSVTVHLSSALLEGTVLTNVAVVTSNTVDPVPDNNNFAASTLVHSPDRDLAITPGVSPAPVQATSAAGAAVTFTTPTASDEDGPVAVTCDAASGSVFPVGSTTVHCSATDADDAPSTVTTTLTVMVVDKDLALTGVPAAVTVNATSPTGAAVSFTPPTAADEETPPAVSCDHASGSTFPIGTTTVTCSATDTDDTPNTTSANFTVTVIGVASQLQGLLSFVQSLPPGTSLAHKVNSAASFFSTNDVADTCSTLHALINEANAQSGKQLTAAQAAQIVSTAKQIEAVIPCP